MKGVCQACHPFTGQIARGRSDTVERTGVLMSKKVSLLANFWFSVEAVIV